MEQRTCNIILCCKGYGTGKNSKEKIINYMAKECSCEPSDYNDGTLFIILKEAAYDYINNCDSPRIFMSNLFETIERYYYSPVLKDDAFTPSDAIIAAFRMISVKNKVRDTWVYVNGFTEKVIKTGHETLGGLRR